MKKKSFTLMEIIIVVVVVGILATIVIPGYRNLVEDSKARICESNLKAMQVGLDIYMLDHETLPAQLSQIPGEYLRKGYASVTQGKDAWKLKLANFIVALEQRGIAYALSYGDFLRNDIAKGEVNLLTCPMAETGANSYGLNSKKLVAGMSRKQYNEIASGVPLIGDCDSSTFKAETFEDEDAELGYRHAHYGIGTKERYAQAVDKDKNVAEIMAEEEVEMERGQGESESSSSSSKKIKKIKIKGRKNIKKNLEK